MLAIVERSNRAMPDKRPQQPSRICFACVKNVYRVGIAGLLAVTELSRAGNDALDRSWAILAGEDFAWQEPDGYRTFATAGDTQQMVLTGQAALNIVWTLLTGFLVMFMQAGFALRRDRPDAREERRPHDGDELPRLFDRHPRLLGARLRPADGGRGSARDVRRRRHAVEEFIVHLARQGVRAVRDEGLLSDARGLHLAGRGAVPVSDGVHGHHRDDPDRRDGRALEVHRRS